MRLSKHILFSVAAAWLAAVSPPAQAASLKVINVSAPAINCVFNASCQVAVTDSLGTIPIAGIEGAARLQTRTFTGAGGAPGASKSFYQYRLSMVQAVRPGNIPCISALKVDFGRVARLDYDKSGQLADVFVITSGAIGTIGLSGAEQTGNIVTFTFSKPVCGGDSLDTGQASLPFGLASNTAPKAIAAQAQVQGGPLVSVQARVPTH